MLKLFKRITEPDTQGASATIRDTLITVDQVHRELMMRTPQRTIQAIYPALDEEDIQAVWVYKAFQNNRDGVIDRQDFISSLKVLPEKITLLQLYDHVDFLFQIQIGISDAIDGKGTPHEQVMRELREYATGLKAKANVNDY